MDESPVDLSHATESGVGRHAFFDDSYVRAHGSAGGSIRARERLEAEFLRTKASYTGTPLNAGAYDWDAVGLLDSDPMSDPDEPAQPDDNTVGPKTLQREARIDRKGHASKGRRNEDPRKAKLRRAVGLVPIDDEPKPKNETLVQRAQRLHDENVSRMAAEEATRKVGRPRKGKEARIVMRVRLEPTTVLTLAKAGMEFPDLMEKVAQHIADGGHLFTATAGTAIARIEKACDNRLDGYDSDTSTKCALSKDEELGPQNAGFLLEPEDTSVSNPGDNPETTIPAAEPDAANDPDDDDDGLEPDDDAGDGGLEVSAEGGC